VRVHTEIQSAVIADASLALAAIKARSGDGPVQHLNEAALAILVPPSDRPQALWTIIMGAFAKGSWFYTIHLHSGAGVHRTGLVVFERQTQRRCWEVSLFIHPAHAQRPFTHDMWGGILTVAQSHLGAHRLEFQVAESQSAFLVVLRNHATGVVEEGRLRSAIWNPSTTKWEDLHLFGIVLDREVA
jgi:RimJ/RimL family protein N-acetyltransferase